MVFHGTMDDANHSFEAAMEPQLQLAPIFSENEFSQVHDGREGLPPFLLFDDEDEDDMNDEDNFDDMDDDFDDDFDDDDEDDDFDDEDEDYDDEDEDYDYEEDVDYDDFDE